MRFYFAASLALATSFSALAQQADLTLPGQRYVSPFNRFGCFGFDEPALATPIALAERDVQFVSLAGDAGLDHYLLIATFDQGQCRYSAILTPSFRSGIAMLNQSKAYSPGAQVDCTEGKSYLDGLLSNVTFSYRERGRKEQALHLPIQGAEELCGEGASHVRATFRFR